MRVDDPAQDRGNERDAVSLGACRDHVEVGGRARVEVRLADAGERALNQLLDRAEARGRELPEAELVLGGEAVRSARGLERLVGELVVSLAAAVLIIFVLLYLSFRRLAPAVLIMTSLPFALIGGIWLLFGLGHHLSVASAVGFIALAGVAAEFGVVMLIYLEAAVRQRRQQGRLNTEDDLRAALVEGAVLRLRPKAMTVVTIIAGLIPLFIGSGAGGEGMQRIAAPMLGGMISAPLLSMLVMPAAWLLWQRRRIGRDVC